MWAHTGFQLNPFGNSLWHRCVHDCASFCPFNCLPSKLSAKVTLGWEVTITSGWGEVLLSLLPLDIPLETFSFFIGDSFFSDLGSLFSRRIKISNCTFMSPIYSEACENSSIVGRCSSHPRVVVCLARGSWANSFACLCLSILFQWDTTDTTDFTGLRWPLKLMCMKFLVQNLA